MKLKNELPFVLKVFQTNINNIKHHKEWLKTQNNYNNFEIRFVHDCLRMFVGTNTLCEWSDKYGCNDKHRFTLGKCALKEIGVL